MDSQVDNPKFKAIRKQNDDHPLEEVGKHMRGMMPWLEGDEQKANISFFLRFTRLKGDTKCVQIY